ncbi:MAG: hypothetical protein K6F69_03695 [Treponema sp.]|nr:hypothetical protein [Treponema sp.]
MSYGYMLLGGLAGGILVGLIMNEKIKKIEEVSENEKTNKRVDMIKSKIEKKKIISRLEKLKEEQELIIKNSPLDENKIKKIIAEQSELLENLKITN